MSQRANTCMRNYLRNHLRRFGARCDSVICQGECGLPRYCQRQKSRRASYLPSLLLLTLTVHPILAQEKSLEPLKGRSADIVVRLHAQQQTPVPPARRSITISDAVSIFWQQNLHGVSDRYDLDTVVADK